MANEPVVSEPKSWTRRMAEALAEEISQRTEVTVAPELLEVALEAASELKAARLRVHLAWCYKLVLALCVDEGDRHGPESGFLAEVLKELR